jgi:hypothetical protein
MIYNKSWSKGNNKSKRFETYTYNNIQPKAILANIMNKSSHMKGYLLTHDCANL